MLKPLRDLRHSLFYAIATTRGVDVETLGDASTGCHWSICPLPLSSNAIVYSGGVGKDITFEHALADRFRCQIWLFDPSTTGIETMRHPANQRPEFHFSPIGLAGENGVLVLAPPTNPDEGSWFASSSDTRTPGSIEVQCQSLGQIMKDRGHKKIDLLKLDIEGAEYGVIENLIDAGLEIDQICVEYHHGMLPGIKRTQTIRSLMKVLSSGYRLLDKFGNNHTFVKAATLKNLAKRTRPSAGKAS